MRNNHIAIPYRSTFIAAVHWAVPIAPTLSTIAGIESTFNLFFASLAQLSLLVGAGSRVHSTKLTISANRHLTTTSRYWESHRPIQVIVDWFIANSNYSSL